MRRHSTLSKLTTWGGLVTAALSATTVLSATHGMFEPSDDPTAASYCYTWGLTNTSPEDADGLRLTVEGPKDVSSFFVGGGNPFGEPESHGPTALGYEARFHGASVSPGQEVHVGLCTRSPLAKLGGADDVLSYAWTRDGVELPEDVALAAPGHAWRYEAPDGNEEGPFFPLLTLSNPSEAPLVLERFEWALTQEPVPQEELEWDLVEGRFDWQPFELQADPVIPGSPGDGDGTLEARVPSETAPDDTLYLLFRTWAVSEDGRSMVRTVGQVQLAALFVAPVRKEADTVRWATHEFPEEKVEPGLRERLEREGELPFLVYLPNQADLSQAQGIMDWDERGKYVLEQLLQASEEGQSELRHTVEQLAAEGRVREYEAFYIVNAIAVTAGADVLEELVERGDVAYIEGFDEYAIIGPTAVREEEGGPDQRASVWNNVGRIGAPDVWEHLGLRGSGVVVGSIDTGVLHTHSALVSQYRGTATGSHDFNWFDATTFDPNNWGSASYQRVPYDPEGHGTHTVGTMVGSGGIGVAPSAQWIAARTGSSLAVLGQHLLRAGQWMLAPSAPAAGLGPDASRRPHVVNNSWGCRPNAGTCKGGGDLWYQAVISNWRAAGILPVFAAGNDATWLKKKKTLRSPGDYAESFTVGATDDDDDIASFSSRGPSTLTGETKPDISAPGKDIRSASHTGGFASKDGTSMAAPHVAGCAALMFEASPQYRLYLELVESFMTGTARDRGDRGPDIHYGHGRLNCFDAVQQAVDMAASLDFMAPGVGWEAQGADIALGNIDTNSRPDVVMMAYDAPPGANTFRYRIGWNLNTNGVPASWMQNHITVSGVGWEGQGAGAALTNLDANTRPELVLMAVDNPPGANTFRYIIGWNLSTSGVASSWSSLTQVGAPGWEAQGGAITFANLGGSSRPDLLFMMYDNPLGANTFRYIVGWDVSTTGVVSSWSPTQIIPGVGWEAQGAGIAVANLGRGSRPDLVLMAYDNPPGDNTFRYRIGWDVGTNGVSTDWGGWVMQVLGGVGWEAQGAGVAIQDINSNGIPEFFLMAYDNPYGPNTFRYRVIQ